MKKNSTQESRSQAIKKIQISGSLAVFASGIFVFIISAIVSGYWTNGAVIVAAIVSAAFAIFFYIFIGEDLEKVIEEENKKRK